MSLYCGCNEESSEWYYYPPDEYKKYEKNRRKKCCSCHSMIGCGDICTEFKREREAKTDLEALIKGDWVVLADWYMCEECSDIYFSITELGYCVTLDSMHDAVKEYAAIAARGR